MEPCYTECGKEVIDMWKCDKDGDAVIYTEWCVVHKNSVHGSSQKFSGWIIVKDIVGYIIIGRNIMMEILNIKES